MASSQWYTSVPALKSLSLQTLPADELQTIASRAASLHAEETKSFSDASSSTNGTKTNASEIAFFSKVVQSGTLSDRLSALTLMVQGSPVHNGKSLEQLRGMAERGKGKGGREESLKALRCIVDWWTGGGAPDRKLRYFRDQPLAHPDRTDAHLIIWYFEDWLKKYFFSVLQILETLSLDPLPYVRTQTLTLIATCLRDKPEQEHNLLRLLVNKLGDPEKSICSRASYHILQVLQKHPSMKGIIVREVSSVVFHTPSSTTTAPAPNKHIRFGDGSKKAPPEKKVKNGHVQYYAAITLNQIVLAPGDQKVALQLISIYFDLFQELLGNPDSFATEKSKDEDEEPEVEVDAKGRVRDKGKKPKRKPGEPAETKGAAGFVETEDSNSRSISALLTGVNRALPYAKLQNADSGVYKHIDTLFAMTHKSTFNTSLQAMVLIQQIASTLDSAANKSTKAATKSVIDRYYRTIYASLHDPRLTTSSKQAMYLNLLFKTIKQDTSAERVKALIRRFVQVLVSGGNASTEFVAGGLYLLGELFSTVPGLRAMVNAPAKQSSEEAYDPKKRDPQYAHADASPLWELTILLRHYHPAIALHARQLLNSEPLTASADLSQNTLSHFLDRFVYKNAKQSKVAEKGKGSSAMQPAASGVEGVKLMKGEAGGQQARVNDPAFAKKRAGDVPVDEMFFHKFFTAKHERDTAKASKVGKRKGQDAESDDEDEGDEEEEDKEDKEDEDEAADSDVSESDLDEDEVWKAMQATMPSVEDVGLGSEDEDDIDSELDIGEEDEELEEDSEGGEKDSEEDDGDEDDLSLAEQSDNDDLVSLNDEIPEGLIPYDGSDADSDSDEEWGGIESGDKKRKRGAEPSEKDKKRKKLRSLPTFASYEDYQKLIEDAPEDDL